MFQDKTSAPRPSAKAAIVEFDSSMGMPIAECIELVATKWYGFEAESIDEVKFYADNTINTQESLRNFAEKLNIELRFRHKRLFGFLPAVFPCIHILKNGNGVIATAENRRGVSLLVNGKKVVVSRNSIRSKRDTLTIVPNPADFTAEKSENQTQEPISTTANFRTSVSWLLSEMLRHNISTLSLMLLAALISNMLMIALPLFIMTVYDRVIPNSALETLWALSIGVLIALGIDLGMRHVRLKLADSVALSNSVAIQAKLLKTMTQAKLEDVPRNTAIWTNSFRDIESATSLVPAMMAAIIVDIPFVVLVLLLIYSIAGPTVIAPILGISLFAIWTFIAQFNLVRTGEKDAMLHNEKTKSTGEIADHIKIVKATNNQIFRLSQFERLLERAIPLTHTLRQQSSMQSQSTMIMVQIVIVLSIVIGVFQISSGGMTIGALAATTLLVGRVLLPAGNVLMLSAKVGQISRSIIRFHSLLQLPQEEMEAKPEQHGIKDGVLELKNVSFSFQNSSSPILSDISLSIARGEQVAIIGKSGSGKSTLIQMLCRLYDPTSGSYLIDQFDSRQFSHVETRKNLAYMPQDTELFDASIFDNLKIGDPDADHDQILDALNVSGANEFIQSNSEGLSFETGRGGEKLSGGERQSIALARTLLCPSKVLLLDEPTSSMDNTTEANVISGIRNTIGDKTLIISTHRANVLSIVDRIIWLDRGRIIADGPRDEILGKLKSAA